jgi:hypothetical protein
MHAKSKTSSINDAKREFRVSVEAKLSTFELLFADTVGALQGIADTINAAASTSVPVADTFQRVRARCRVRSLSLCVQCWHPTAGGPFAYCVVRERSWL